MAGGIEKVKHTLQKWIRSSRFGDMVAAVDAESVADGIDDGTRATPLPPADCVYTYDRAVLPNYPAVEIIGASSNYAADTDATMRRHRIAIVFTQVGDVEELITRDIDRLIEAAARLFRGSVLDTRDGVRPIEIEIEDYSRLDAGVDGKGAFIKGGSLMLAVPTFT